MSVHVSSPPRNVTSETLRQAIGLGTVGLKFSGVGDIHSSHSNQLLSFIKDEKYIGQVNDNKAISGVFCKVNTAPQLRRDIVPIIVEDPGWSFFTLIDYLGKTRIYGASLLESRFLDVSVSVAPVGVTIGREVILEEYVSVKPGTTIQDRVVVRSGAVLGLDTFQHQRTSRGIVSPAHDGDLIVQSDVEIGAKSTISKGFSYRPTTIGRYSKLDAGVYVGHGAQIGSEAIICAGAKIMGHCRIEDGAFIGPGAIVSNRVIVGRNSRVSLGAVVTKDVPADQTVTGNFAVRHEIFIASLKQQTNLTNDRNSS